MRKLSLDTPVKETEAILKEHVRKLTESIHNSGRPVRRGDHLGVYDLYKDGTKEYVKKYDNEK